MPSAAVNAVVPHPSQRGLTPPAVSTGLLGIVLLASTIGLGSPSPARADVAGTVCVESGDTLYVNGHRSYGRCHGGQAVVLYGIDAPELKQTCVHEGQAWPCGRTSARALLQMTLHHTVICHGNSRDRDDRLIAVCHVGDVELNRVMVEMGLAVSDGTRYAREEGQARAAHRGMWMGTFDRPADWRASH